MVSSSDIVGLSVIVGCWFIRHSALALRGTRGEVKRGVEVGLHGILEITRA